MAGNLGAIAVIVNATKKHIKNEWACLEGCKALGNFSGNNKYIISVFNFIINNSPEPTKGSTI